MSLRRRTARPAEAGIDMTPIIDMTFMLLIFFMVSATFVKDLQVELERPAAQSASRASERSLRIHIDRAGAVYVDGAPVKLWMLQSRVRDAIRAAGASKQVLVIVDRRVPAERLIEVVDQCRLAGAVDVGVATSAEAGG